MALEEEWTVKHRAPGAASHKEKAYPLMPHLEDEVSAPLTKSERLDCRQEWDEACPTVRERQWSKSGKKQKTWQQKQAKARREEGRLKRKQSAEAALSCHKSPPGPPPSENKAGSGSVPPEPKQLKPSPPPGPPPWWNGKDAASGRVLALKSPVEEAKSAQTKWQKLVVTLDSGASDNVMPVHLAKQQCMGPVKGVKEFATATGFKIPNLGSVTMDMYLPDWRKFSSNWSVADVKRPLLSMTKVLQNGHKVVMDAKCSYIQMKSGQRINLDLSTGVPTFSTWVLMPFPGQPKMTQA